MVNWYLGNKRVIACIVLWNIRGKTNDHQYDKNE